MVLEGNPQTHKKEKNCASSHVCNNAQRKRKKVRVMSAATCAGAAKALRGATCASRTFVVSLSFNTKALTGSHGVN